jgi:hypothetical protein
MALYTDGPPSSIEDLSAQDSQLLDVASTEGIDLTKKLALAHEQVGIEIEALLRRRVPTAGWGSTTYAPGIASVVVTAPLRLWHTYRTLRLVYSDAYYNQSNDRYARKRDEFEQQAKWAYAALLDAGLGITGDPIPMAPTPTVTAAAGLLPAGTYYVTASWVNAAGEEGAPAVPTSLSVSNQTLLVQPGSAPSNATGWNVYIGSALDWLVRQNAASIPPGSNWLQPGIPAANGATPGQGQPAAYLCPVPRMIQRG